METTYRVFGHEDFRRWLDDRAREIFGITGEQFVRDYTAGRFAGRAVADDVASVLFLLRDPHGA